MTGLDGRAEDKERNKTGPEKFVYAPIIPRRVRYMRVRINRITRLLFARNRRRRIPRNNSRSPRAVTRPVRLLARSPGRERGVADGGGGARERSLSPAAAAKRPDRVIKLPAKSPRSHYL